MPGGTVQRLMTPESRGTPLSSGIGERLRRAREARGLSLAEVERETKIRQGYLAALEEERFETLPGHVYAKGYLQAYTRLLGLDSRAFLETFELRAGSGLSRVSSRAWGRTAHDRMTVRRGRRPRWWILVLYGALGLPILFVLNWGYQVARKPAELLSVFSAPLSKSPRATWQSYGEAFREHSTEVISAEFLAALAQVESRGNPLVGTYWRWKWSWNPLEVYRPASSAVGLFQITDGTFEEMRKYCIHDHKVAERGSWYDQDSCWFTGLYSRLIPDHAIEMTAAYLHRVVERLLAKHRRDGATIRDRRRLAGIVHLCGMGRGGTFARRGFRLSPGERCGSHSVGRYLSRLHALEHEFTRLSAE